LAVVSLSGAGAADACDGPADLLSHFPGPPPAP